MVNPPCVLGSELNQARTQQIRYEANREPEGVWGVFQERLCWEFASTVLGSIRE